MEKETVTLVPWSVEAEFYIRQALSVEATYEARTNIEKGVSQLWRCQDLNGQLAGYVLTQLTTTEHGKEWVWVAGAGKGFLKIMPAFVDAADTHHVPIRAHVNRPGLIRFYERLGFTVSETIMRRRVKI